MEVQKIINFTSNLEKRKIIRRYEEIDRKKFTDYFPDTNLKSSFLIEKPNQENFIEHCFKKENLVNLPSKEYLNNFKQEQFYCYSYFLSNVPEFKRKCLNLYIKESDNVLNKITINFLIKYKTVNKLINVEKMGFFEKLCGKNFEGNSLNIMEIILFYPLKDFKIMRNPSTGKLFEHYIFFTTKNNFSEKMLLLFIFFMITYGLIEHISLRTEFMELTNILFYINNKEEERNSYPTGRLEEIRTLKALLNFSLFLDSLENNKNKYDFLMKELENRFLNYKNKKDITKLIFMENIYYEFHMNEECRENLLSSLLLGTGENFYFWNDKPS